MTARGATLAVFAGIYAVTLALTLYRIDAPLLDYYPVRQVQTAEITRNLYRADHNPFVPKRFNGPDLKAFILEFPLYNSVVALGYALTGGVHETIGRLVSLACWIGAGLCLFGFVRPNYGDAVALASVFFFHLSRIGIQISRSFQPDAMMVFLALAALYSWDRWLRREHPGIPLAPAVITTLALLVKLPIAHIALPIGYLALFADGRKRRLMLAAGTIALAVALAWNTHARTATIAETPDFAGNWVLSNWFSLSRLAGADFYRTLFAIWRADLFGSVAFLLAAFGALMRPSGARERVFHVWLAGVTAYILFFNAHVVTHDYYNVPLLAVGAVFAARAFADIPRLVAGLFVPGRLAQAAVAAMVVLTTASYLRTQAYAVLPSERGVLPTSAELQRLANPEAVVVVGSQVLGYYADRRSFELAPGTPDAVARLERYRARGAELFATADRTRFLSDEPLRTHLQQHYPLISQGEHFLIFALKGPAGRGSDAR